jgi:hypothetical protein
MGSRRRIVVRVALVILAVMVLASAALIILVQCSTERPSSFIWM